MKGRNLDGGGRKRRHGGDDWKTGKRVQDDQWQLVYRLGSSGRVRSNFKQIDAALRSDAELQNAFQIKKGSLSCVCKSEIGVWVQCSSSSIGVAAVG